MSALAIVGIAVAAVFALAAIFTAIGSARLSRQRIRADIVAEAAARAAQQRGPGNSPAVDEFIHHLGEDYERRAGRRLPGYGDYQTYTVRPDETGGERS